MLFTSFNFLIFLAVLVALYAITPQRFRWFVLLVGSMTFYGFAGLHFLIYINATIVITYLCTIKIKHLRLLRDAEIEKLNDLGLSQENLKEARRSLRDKTKRKAKGWTTLCLVLIIGILATVKYTDFAIENFNTILRLFNDTQQFSLIGIAVPLGISFYTFQTVGYVIDVYREKAEIVKNPLKLALFTSFFPQVIQGPISRFENLSKTLYSGTQINRHGLARGSQRILWGFFKKLVIADRLWPALAFLATHPEEYQGIYYLFAIALYAVVLYCDFSGGIDIAIGAAELFGVRLPENFNRPFYSRSIQEYWQRWHMTMYSWFRDYVFYPMAASKRMLRFSKASRRVVGNNFAKRLPVHISLIFVWFLTGLWHGATWNFIMWGMANGIVLMISLELTPLYERFNKHFPTLSNEWFYRSIQIFRTFWLMNFIRSFDIYDGVKNTFRMMWSVVANFSLNEFLTFGLSELKLSTEEYISALAGLLIVFFVSFLGRGDIDFRDRLGEIKWPLRYTLTGVVLFMTLVLGAYGHGFDARQFIYNIF
ncbi:MAG: MBOAT family protein [Oscillospiraceae bacterium]|jgi:D-alanyl-lipoteichoic acid acyltransferase DltB (MBOAT superfamily)|nr:MBOAT family protein [Oscillospiraceae bacterium]